ncbi:MAG: hypothetical protein Q8912_03155 [Bacillota bacterium]|nr:hypothetical protein [Bacillota bacterium]
METYFHNDPQIEEWIDQITEKIFAVCLLTGNDSDAEFQRGSQIVTKVTSMLLGISKLPSEYLEDGLRQLLEQQLPDKRVINNFPSFQDIMDKMLHEGMSKALGSQHEGIQGDARYNMVLAGKENTPEVFKECINENIQQLGEVLEEENVTETAIPALATVIDSQHIQEDEYSSGNLPDHEYIQYIKKELDVAQIEPIPDKIVNIVKDSEQNLNLKHVLNIVFPNSSVRWNIVIKDQEFVAQVENVLIYLNDPEHPDLTDNLNIEGWKVFVCNPEDLSFPRRLERGIREVLRSGRNLLIV